MYPVRYELGFYIPEDDILHRDSLLFALLGVQRNVFELLRTIAEPIVRHGTTEMDIRK
jgi:hypothetical protein